MGLDHRTIQKLFREDFLGENPLVVQPAEREPLGQQISAQLERIDGVDTKESGYLRDDEKDQHVCSFSIVDPHPKYRWRGSDHFRLRVDEENRLTIATGRYGNTASTLVSDLAEIQQFVLHCRQRLERRKALATKREKVRQLKVQAILAQVKTLAKEQKFDFLSETYDQKLKLFVKLSEQHAVELDIPFKQFDEILPQLSTAIVSLRQLYESGIRFKIIGQKRILWRKQWTRHEDL